MTPKYRKANDAAMHEAIETGDSATYQMDVTDLVEIDVNGKVIISLSVDPIPLGFPLFREEFTQLIMRAGLGDAFYNRAHDAVNAEFMRAQMANHIIENAK